MIAGLENKFEESLKLNKRTDIGNRIITRRYIQEAQYVTNKNVEEVQKRKLYRTFKRQRILHLRLKDYVIFSSKRMKKLPTTRLIQGNFEDAGKTRVFNIFCMDSQHSSAQSTTITTYMIQRAWTAQKLEEDRRIPSKY